MYVCTKLRLKMKMMQSEYDEHSVNSFDTVVIISVNDLFQHLFYFSSVNDLGVKIFRIFSLQVSFVQKLPLRRLSEPITGG